MLDVGLLAQLIPQMAAAQVTYGVTELGAPRSGQSKGW
jgi:hypothetical protein